MNPKNVVLLMIGAILVVAASASFAFAQQPWAPWGIPYSPGPQGWSASGMGTGMGGGGMMGGMGYHGMGMMGGQWGGMGPGLCQQMMQQYWAGNASWPSFQLDQVAIRSFWFHPPSLTVPVGTTVTWTNYDAVAHTVTAGTPQQPTGLFNSGLLQQGQSFSYTFSQPGTYTYFCEPHPNMVGQIVVIQR